jgi:hypothetical protein
MHEDATNGTNGTADRLDGWGEIATYLRRDIRTVQRWEKQEALPIHRHSGVKPRVWANRSELDAWWQTRTADETADVPAARSAAAPPGRTVRFRNLRLRWILLAAPAIGILSAVLIATALTDHSEVPAVRAMPDRIFARVTAEGGQVSSIPVRGYPITLVLAPDGSELYVLDNFRTDEMQVIDPGRGVVIRTVSIAGQPLSAAFSPDGQRLYVGTQLDGLYILDRRDQIVDVIRHDVTGQVRDVAVTPDGKRVFLALERAGLREFDVAARRVRAIPNVVCPESLAIDREGRYLFASAQCGETRGIPGRESVEIIDLATNTTVNSLHGPPLIAGNLTLFPNSGRLWVNGLDACSNPQYNRYDLTGCPFVPGNVHHIFQTGNGALVRTLGVPATEWMDDPVFTPEGDRAILSGDPLRVVDTQVFETEESFSLGHTTNGAPVLDSRRRRVYAAGLRAGKIHVIDLPAKDCNVPSSGLVHHWTGDGNGSDRRSHESLTGVTEFAPGIIGRAFSVEGTRLEAASPNPSIDAGSVRDGTVQMWTKRQGPGGGVLFEYRQETAAFWHVGVSADDRLFVKQTGLPPFESSAKLVTGRWHHIAVVRSGNRLTLYLDSVLVLEAPAPPLVAIPRMQRLRVGPWPGLVDEVALHERALEESEIRAILANAQSCATGSNRSL